MQNKYTKENLGKAIAENQSMAGVMRSFGIKPSGGSHYHLLLKARGWGIDMSHFTGQAHLRGKSHNWSNKTPLAELMTEGSKTSRTSLKRRMIREGILKNECGICGQNSEWRCSPLPLILDHINGVRNDNRKENLRLLCPNCNSQTDTFCSRNRKQHDDQHLLSVVQQMGVRRGAVELGMTVGGVRHRMRLIRGCAGVGKRA